jgi:hypothetical protein
VIEGMAALVVMVVGLVVLVRLGQPRPTPRHVARGVTLEEAQAVCTPSRACTITGMYADQPPTYGEDRDYRAAEAQPHHAWWDGRAAVEVMDARTPGQLTDGARPVVIDGREAAKALPEGGYRWTDLEGALDTKSSERYAKQ